MINEQRGDETEAPRVGLMAQAPVSDKKSEDESGRGDQIARKRLEKRNNKIDEGAKKKFL